MLNRNQILSDAMQCICDNCAECSQSGMHCMEDLITDMLNLLEWQDAVAPKVSTHGLVESYRCGNCGKHLVNATYARDNYCSKCGRAVKWNE